MNHERKNSLAPAIVSGFAALVLSAGAAFAAAPEKDPGQQHSTQATDRAAAANAAESASATSSTPATSNGEMSSSDSLAAQTKFDALDMNHDGSIDKQEAAASKQLNAQFAKLDKNKDGKLSMTEFNTAKDIASIKVDRKSQQ